jgi:hypothetical protein
MALWDDLTNIVSSVGDWFSSADNINTAVNTASTINNLMDGMADAPSASSSSGGLLSSIGNFATQNANWLVPLLKEGAYQYLQSGSDQDLINTYQPLMSMNQQTQDYYTKMLDPQVRALSQARLARNYMNQAEPMLSRIGAMGRMGARSRGTPWGASTTGNYQQDQFRDLAMKTFGQAQDLAQAQDVKNVNQTLNMLTNRYNTAAGAPQFMPETGLGSAINRDPLRSAILSLLK